MNGTLSLAKAEIIRLRRNKRYLLFTLALPVLLYMAFGRSTGRGYGVDFKAFYMVGMATLGGFSGVLTGNAQRISQEMKDGWIRQLRITPLPANAYVVSKILAALTSAIPVVLVVLLLGRFYGGVHLAAWQWIAVAVTIWFGSTIFAALAVAIGYKFQPDQVQALSVLLYLGFAFLGGLYFPLGGAWQKVGDALPTYAVVKISTDVIEGASVPAGLAIGLVIWLAVFAGLATLAVRSSAETL
ncbi:MAG TPA: ABC transporter permease [Streptosporangiaceae bacterium]|nr:ABC transporter permease [Streptosporangiaceae bacterium]